ncbi:MAG: hypothetical protein KDC44_18030 [Phaeodactylibacter sp.]|nr:hypothetical protein [Phaeodactylibacter sp.]
MNSIRKERFYVQFQCYNYNTQLNQIVRKTLLLIQKVSTNPTVLDRTAMLLMKFPALKVPKITVATFDQLHFNRKTERYRPALHIARLLLLNFHPGLQGGQHQVLALLFNMNQLWEKFLFRLLRKETTSDFSVAEQVAKPIWQRQYVRPDILIDYQGQKIILDAKWKALTKAQPSAEDLRQMFAYNHHFNASRSILVYPKVHATQSIAAPFHQSRNGQKHYCEMLFLRVLDERTGRLDMNLGQTLKMKLIGK